MDVDWSELVDLDDADRQSALLALADAAMDGLGGAEEDRALAGLPEPARAIWLLNWFEFEVELGGLSTYFLNSHGRHAGHVADVFRAMGAERTAATLATAIAIAERGAADFDAAHERMDEAGAWAIVTPLAEADVAEELGRIEGDVEAAMDADGWSERLDAYLLATVRSAAG